MSYQLYKQFFCLMTRTSLYNPMTTLISSSFLSKLRSISASSPFASFLSIFRRVNFFCSLLYFLEEKFYRKTEVDNCKVSPLHALRDSHTFLKWRHIQATRLVNNNRNKHSDKTFFFFRYLLT